MNLSECSKVKRVLERSGVTFKKSSQYIITGYTDEQLQALSKKLSIIVETVRNEPYRVIATTGKGITCRDVTKRVEFLTPLKSA